MFTEFYNKKYSGHSDEVGNQMKPKIHIISIQEAYITSILKQLKLVFADKVSFSTLIVKNLEMNDINEGDIVVLSRLFLMSVIRPFIPKNCPVIIANREVNIVNTKKLIDLPPGKKILVINDMPENTKETAASLKNIFNTHTFYFDDVDNPTQTIPEDIDYIVTPGEMDIVPNQYSNVIDIGPRLLSYGTLWEIVQSAGIDFTHEQLVNHYIKSQVSLAGVRGEERENKLTQSDVMAINSKIEEHGFLEESLKILELYVEGKRNLQTFGRLKLKDQLEKHSIHLSEQQLRLRLEVLQELGLLIARQGRGGTMITALGEQYFQTQNENTVHKI